MTHIWRAKLHHQELTDCGFTKAETDEQRWFIISGLLKAKGLPDWCTQDRTPFKCSEEPDGLMLEFDG